MSDLTDYQILMLRRMIRRQFDECEWYMEEEVIELARKMGFDDLAEEMENDQALPMTK